jgi:Xaa-Pro aminopeptidase
MSSNTKNNQTLIQDYPDQAVKDDQALIRQKLDQATKILNELDIDVWLTFVRESSMEPDPCLELIYGGDVTWVSAFLICRNGRHIAIVGHFDAENVHALNAYSEVIGYHEGISGPLNQTIAEINPRQIAINYSQIDFASDGLTVGLYRMLRGYLRDTPYEQRLVSAEEIIFGLRGRKSPIEIDRVRKAIATTEELFGEIETFVKPGMIQSQIASFVHDRVASRGLDYAWPKPFNPTVTCGPYSVVGHVSPGDVTLQKGHTLHIDLGIKEAGYCSDIQRMWYVLEHHNERKAPPDVQDAFDTVVGALKVGEHALQPGVPGWQVDARARAYIVDHGYDEYLHALGHLVGRAAHDGGIVLGPRWERYNGICELPVEVGNIFALELHVFVPNRGVVSLEENVLVTANGVEYLSTPQTEFRYIHA